METTDKHILIARIENNFIFNAQYLLTAREQKIMLFLISKINPTDKNFQIQVISLKELKGLIMKNRSGSFYAEMIDFAARISQKQIVFESDIRLDKKKIKGIINWFQSIVPVYNEEGDLCLEFEFSNKLKPYLLQLKEYTQIDYLETLPLGSSFSIRMYQVFRAYRDKMRKHQKKSKLVYELENLKMILGVADKYKDWRKFNERVLKVIAKEVNEHTSVNVKINKQTKGRKVVGVEFEIWEKGNATKKSEKHKNAENLSFAELRAFNLLCEFGITEAIALEMLSKCKGSETKGFEDWYFESVIQIFETKTEQTDSAAKAGTLVNWFVKKKIFEQGDMFARIMEQLAERKKQLQTANEKAWDNRMIAKDMTAEAFRERVT